MQIDENVNDVHMNQNGLLRSALTVKVPGSDNHSHMLVYIVAAGDKLYTVSNFPEYLQEQLEEDIDERRLTDLNYDEDITHALNSLEKVQANGTALVGMMINSDFDSSYVITAVNA